MEKIQVFTGTLTNSSKRFDRQSLSWRMYLPLHGEEGEVSMSSNPLPTSGMMRNGRLYLRTAEEQTTCANDGSSLPILPTPSCNEAKNNPSAPAQWDRNSSLNVEVARQAGYTQRTIGKSARLNHRYVEWMMGFPEGWTDIPTDTE